jgi:hypothetical protein
MLQTDFFDAATGTLGVDGGDGQSFNGWPGVLNGSVDES